MAEVRMPFRRRYPTPRKEFDEVWGNQLVRDLLARDQDVNNAFSIFEYSDTFLIDSTGVITVTFSTVLGFIPHTSHTQISISRETNVTDWGYKSLWVDSASATSIVGKINIDDASATGSAKARMNIWVRSGDAIDILDSA